MEYEIKVRLTGKSSDYTKLKKDLNEAMDKKVVPGVKDFLTQALLFRNISGLGLGTRYKTLDDFRAQNAGLLTVGLLDHVNKNNINKARSEVAITKNDMVLTTEIKLVLKPQAPEKEGIIITSETIIRKAFNPAFIDDIFNKAVKGLKDK